MYRDQLEDSFTVCSCCNKGITIQYDDGEVIICQWEIAGGFYETGSTFWTRLWLAWRALTRGFGFVADMHFNDLGRLDKFIDCLTDCRSEMVRFAEEEDEKALKL